MPFQDFFLLLSFLESPVWTLTSSSPTCPSLLWNGSTEYNTYWLPAQVSTQQSCTCLSQDCTQQPLWGKGISQQILSYNIYRYYLQKCIKWTFSRLQSQAYRNEEILELTFALCSLILKLLQAHIMVQSLITCWYVTFFLPCCGDDSGLCTEGGCCMLDSCLLCCRSWKGM